jgi:hypothetical protein
MIVWSPDTADRLIAVMVTGWLSWSLATTTDRLLALVFCPRVAGKAPKSVANWSLDKTTGKLLALVLMPKDVGRIVNSVVIRWAMRCSLPLRPALAVSVLGAVSVNIPSRSTIVCGLGAGSRLLLAALDS